MKTFNRFAAALVAAVMLMVMLAGCGGGSTPSVASQLRQATGTTKSSALDNAAKLLASDTAALTENSVSIALDGFGDMLDDADVESFSGGSLALAYTYNIDSSSTTVEVSRIDVFFIAKFDSTTVNELQTIVEMFGIDSLKASCDGSGADLNVYLAAESCGTSGYVLILDFAITPAADSNDDIFEDDSGSSINALVNQISGSINI